MPKVLPSFYTSGMALAAFCFSPITIPLKGGNVDGVSTFVPSNVVQACLFVVVLVKQVKTFNGEILSFQE